MTGRNLYNFFYTGEIMIKDEIIHLPIYMEMFL